MTASRSGSLNATVFLPNSELHQRFAVAKGIKAVDFRIPFRIGRQIQLVDQARGQGSGAQLLSSEATIDASGGPVCASWGLSTTWAMRLEPHHALAK